MSDLSWSSEVLADIPNAKDFRLLWESKNFPLVLKNVTSNWPALRKWNPEYEGLSYLSSLAGEVNVQVMMSSTGSTFYGAVGSHERCEVSFGHILSIAERRRQSSEDSTATDPTDPSGSTELNAANQETKNMNIYLAQAPIFDREKGTEARLDALLADITPYPSCLDASTVSNVNLWLSLDGSRSSIHYDPYQNFLCPVVGVRIVTLWPPHCSAFLYPMAIYGEASNHSAVDFASPDLGLHPLFARALSQSQSVAVAPGDALFIPEGWWHQVDCHGTALAVNIWWPSEFSRWFGSHMDSYYARRFVSSLVDKERKSMLGRNADSQEGAGKLPEAADMQQKDDLNRLQLAVYHLTSNVPPLRTKRLRFKTAVRPAGTGGRRSLILAGSSRKSAQDEVCRVMSAMDPVELKGALLHMAVEFPGMLQTWILRHLSPAAAEILTMKFEMGDLEKESSACQVEDFYGKFYGVFDDHREAFSSILSAKEDFGRSASLNVLEKYLGLRSISSFEVNSVP